MARKVIQVPVDEQLLNDLDSLSKRQHKARAELIRQACRRYLQQVEYEELDRLYRRGYEKTPEEPEVGETQVAMAGQFMPKESW